VSVECDCIEPGAVQDWELDACVDGEALPHVVEHLERCPACRARLAEQVAMERSLHQVLYRFDCPSPDLLRDYYWGDLAADEYQRVESHLDVCPHCAAELADMAGFVKAERTEPSSDLLARARRAAAQVRLIVAQLAAPGLSLEPARRADARLLPALRGDTRYMLLFDAEDVMVSVNLEREATGTYAILGQVLSPEPVIPAGGYARLTARAEGVDPVQVQLDVNGGFSLANLRPGMYQLLVCLQDRRIVVPTLELKAEL
jgi:anti-sigma factor RsiW